MTPERFQQITSRYNQLTIAVLGDFCLDRYLEIDPAREEISLETGLPVYNVTHVRPQPGGAGTVLNNVVALGVGKILPLGFAGDDGEGFELLRALRQLPGVCMDGFQHTALRRTFTYCKPLILRAGEPPCELNRLDSKNWTPTPAAIEDRLMDALQRYANDIDALIVMDQVDAAGTGAVTPRVLDAIKALGRSRPDLPILADSRRSLRGYGDVCLKMNRAELGMLLGGNTPADLDQTQAAALELAKQHGRDVFITLAEAGILGASPNGDCHYFASLPVHGEIDIVGAGDSVTANLTVARAADASLQEALELANAAASVVIHQLGTTGSASVDQLAKTLGLPQG